MKNFGNYTDYDKKDNLHFESSAKNLSEIKTGYFTNGKDTYYARI